MNSKESQNEPAAGQSLKTNLHPKSSPPANFTVKNASKPLAQYTANIAKKTASAPKPTDIARKSNIPIVENMKELESKLSDAGKKLVVIDFFATWCGPCKMIAPKVEEMDEDMDDVAFLKVDVDDAEGIAEEYQIKAMPTFVLIKNKKKVILIYIPRTHLHYGIYAKFCFPLLFGA